MPRFVFRLLRCLAALAALAILAGPGVAGAQTTCTGTPQTFVLDMPARIAVPRDVPVGTPLTPWISSEASTGWFQCTSTGPFTGLASGVPIAYPTSTGMLYVSDGGNWTVYKTNVDGVGIAVNARAYLGPCGGWFSWRNLTSLGPQARCNKVGLSQFGGQVRVILVKTGPVSGGTVNGGLLAQIGAYPDAAGVMMSFQASSTVVDVAACTTPNVIVDLGSHRTNEFGGVGSALAPVNFNINVNGCPAGMAKIQYRIDPVTTVVDAGNAVVALGSGSTARGVGIQLLDGNGNPFPFSASLSLTGYDPANGGDYAIGLQARFYQTSAPVFAGTVKAGMTFTMSYQ